MAERIEGRLGDISGRLGDISGRLGDISGRLGDISGHASAADVQDCLTDDRQADKVRFIEQRIARIETEIILIIRWVHAQLQLGGSTGSSTLEQEVSRMKDDFEKRIADLEKGAQGTPSQPPPTPHS
jgi:hypothetical protein